MIRFALALCLWPVTLAAEVRFEDHSDQLGGHSYTGGWEHFVGGGVAVFDCNGDTLPEIFAAGGSSSAALWRNDGGFRFSPLALPEITGVTGAYPADLDGDGVLDLFVLRVGPNVTLKGGPECAFTVADIGLPMGDAWSTAFTAWYDAGQSRPTLAIGNYVDLNDPDGPFEACDDNTLLRPEAEGWSAQPLTPGFCALSLLAAQDARGRQTLRLSNDRHYYVRGGSEQMWDISEGRFLGPDDGWDAPQLWGMGIASRDLTGDGRDEVLLTSMGDQLLQLAGENGHYTPAPFSIGTYAQRPHLGSDGRPSTGWHAQFGDLNNDGLPDLFISKGNVDQMPSNAMEDPNNLLMQRPDGTFVETSITAGVASLHRSRGAALADFDLDGRLDLVVINRRAEAELYRNNTAGTGNWISVDLAQGGPNPSAIGARVFVDAGGQTQNQQRTIGGGHAGGQFGPLHFGLGDADSVTLRVVWPDGAEQEPIIFPANTRATVTRGND
ncbi:MAG: CRTAC1 family protein [Octadecabacter sp.]|nr:CRTAC1 family protein [Octadecabacter sp.]